VSAAVPEGERQIVLVRHAETEWSANGRHTGLTDLPLTERGRDVARALAPRLQLWRFALVLVSPLRRARETAQLSGLGKDVVVCDDLHEWDYGEYEGLTTAQIRAQRPDWNLWRDGCPNGETAPMVGARADAVIERMRDCAGDVAAFSHGHMLRVVGARWIELEPQHGASLMLATGSLSVLGHEHGRQAFASWSCTSS
jgi:broad specificity phosphatase PhoE